MAQECGPLVDRVAQRIRDVGNTGHSRQVIWRVMTEAQRLVNATTAAVVNTHRWKLDPRRCLYPVESIGLTAADPKIIRVKALEVEGLTLQGPCDWQAVTRTNLFWFRAVADVPRVWAPIGRGLLLIYPAPLSDGKWATITYVPVLPPLQSDEDMVLLPPEMIPPLLDMTEALLQLRGRMYGYITSPAVRAGAIMGLRYGEARRA